MILSVPFYLIIFVFSVIYFTKWVYIRPGIYTSYLAGGYLVMALTSALSLLISLNILQISTKFLVILAVIGLVSYFVGYVLTTREYDKTLSYFRTKRQKGEQLTEEDLQCLQSIKEEQLRADKWQRKK